jgi:hypothetical protein
VDKAFTQLCAGTSPSPNNASEALFSSLYMTARLRGLQPDNATDLVNEFMEGVGTARRPLVLHQQRPTIAPESACPVALCPGLHVVSLL